MQYVVYIYVYVVCMCVTMYVYMYMYTAFLIYYSSKFPWFTFRNSLLIGDFKVSSPVHWALAYPNPLSPGCIQVIEKFGLSSPYKTLFKYYNNIIHTVTLHST